MNHHFCVQESQCSLSRRAFIGVAVAGGASLPFGGGTLAETQTDHPDDPLLKAINRFREGDKAFCQLEEADWERYGGAENAIEFTYGRPLRVLEEWDTPAASLEGALEAIRIAYHENEWLYGDPVVGAMLSAALAFFDRKAPNGDKTS